MSFEPRGKVAVLLAAMREQPQKIVWPADQVAATMDVVQKNLPAYLQAVITRQMLHRKIENGKSFFSLKPFPSNVGTGLDPRLMPSPEYSAEEREAARSDVRAPKADPGWSPPKMIATRGRSEVARAPLPAPLPASTAPAPIATHAPEPLPPPSAPPAPIRTRAPEPQPQEPAPDAEAAEEEAEAVEFNARQWLDGDLDLFGLVETEDGAHRITAENVMKLRKLLAWMPC